MSAYRDQQRWNRENPSLRRPVTSIALRVGRVTSPRTIHRWAKEGTTQATLRKNLSRRGRRPLLNELQKCLIMGHAVHRRSEQKPVNRAHLVDFCRDYLNIKIAPQRISDLLKEAGWSRQKSMSRASRLTTGKVVSDAMKLVKELREQEYPPECLYVMDETGLWSTTTEPRTYNPRGRFPSAPFCFFASPPSLNFNLNFPPIFVRSPLISLCSSVPTTYFILWE